MNDHRTGDRTDHESDADAHHVEDHHVFQKLAVENVEDEIERDQSEKRGM